MTRLQSFCLLFLLFEFKEGSALKTWEERSGKRHLNMKKKAIVSMLAFSLGIFLVSYLCLSVYVGRSLEVSAFMRFSKAVLWNALLHSKESGGSRSLDLAKDVVLSSAATGVTEINEHRYSYPLPKYSFKQELQLTHPVSHDLKRYVTFATFGELQDYFHHKLPAAGWKHIDQAGSGHAFKRDGTNMVITHRYFLGTSISELTVSVTP